MPHTPDEPTTGPGDVRRLLERAVAVAGRRRRLRLAVAVGTLAALGALVLLLAGA